MIKLIITFVLVAGITAQMFPGAINPLQTVGLQSITNAIATGAYPEDLQQAAVRLLDDSENGFKACDEVALIWQQKKCQAFQLRNIMLSLAAFQREVELRQAAETIPSA